MKTIRGVETLNMQEDVLGNLGRINFCRMIEEKIRGGYEEFKNLYSFIIDTSNITNLPKPYKMIFIPINLVEEQLVLDAMKSLQETKDDLLSKNSICEIQKIYLRQKNRVDKIESSYNFKNILNAKCVMILYSNETFIDARIMRPAEALKIFEENKISKYVCSVCGKQHKLENDGAYRPLPDILYEEKGDGISYYCESCTDKKLNRLGE